MLNVGKKVTTAKGTEERCDIRVWSGACEDGTDNDTSEKYLCKLCETIPSLDHEVRHEIFPHVSGDYELMM